MVNFIFDKYADFKSNVRKNILATGQNYMWYLTMGTFCAITYVLYSYSDTNSINVKSLYAILMLTTANAYIINILTEPRDLNTQARSSDVPTDA